VIIIAENLNVMSRKIGEAVKERNPAPIREMAEAVAATGVDMIDVNLGPARKNGAGLMEWVVRTVQEVTDLPLSLDTSSIEAIEAGLAVSKQKALINSISVRPERMQALMPLVKRYGAAFIGLLLGPEGLPRDANERGLLAATIMAESAEQGIPEDDIWIDPIILPVNTQQLQVSSCTEFVAMLKDLAPNCRSTGGLSNVSNGVPARLRGLVNRTYLMMVKRYGFDSVIADAFDTELRAIARDERPELESLIQRAMDGQIDEMAGMEPEEVEYVKTVRVLMAQTLYSDSWLEL
jgi:5-methyltetrahydrofolate corrinoid/iron sulfur protein methyltransferase